MDVDDIENIIAEFVTKYNLDLEQDDIGAFIYQSESAYKDAVESFVKIIESCIP